MDDEPRARLVILAHHLQRQRRCNLTGYEGVRANIAAPLTIMSTAKLAVVKVAGGAAMCEQLVANNVSHMAKNIWNRREVAAVLQRRPVRTWHKTPPLALTMSLQLTGDFRL